MLSEPPANGVPEVDADGNVALENLIDLRLLSPADRVRVRGVTANKFGGALSPNWLPPSLERLSCGDPLWCDARESLQNDTLPPLPATLTQLFLGFYSKYNARHADIATHLQHACSTATALREVAMPVYHGSQVAALPPSVEQLFVKHFTSSPIPRAAWPKSLKALTIDCDNEAEVSLDQMELPGELVSITLPESWDYEHYDRTIAELANTSGSTLRSIRIGSGCSNFSGDLFAALPRQIEVITFAAVSDEDPQARVESLPDTVRILEWEVKEPVSRWPARLEKLSIIGHKFNGSIDALPDSVQVLRLPDHYNTPVTRWPSGLRTLSLGARFTDEAGLLRLPATLENLDVPITLARKLMEARRLPTSLKHLVLLGRPNPTRAIDVRQLPPTCTILTLDFREGDKPLLIGRREEEENARRDVRVKIAELTRGMQGQRERDMETVLKLHTDPQYALQDGNENENGAPAEPVIAEMPSEVAYPKSSFPSFGSVEHGWVDKATLFDRLKHATAENPVRSLLLKEAGDEDVLKVVAAALRQGRIAGTLALLLDNQEAVRPRAARNLLAAIAEAHALTKLSIKGCQQLLEAAARPDIPAGGGGFGRGGFGGGGFGGAFGFGSSEGLGGATTSFPSGPYSPPSGPFTFGAPPTTSSASSSNSGAPPPFTFGATPFPPALGTGSMPVFGLPPMPLGNTFSMGPPLPPPCAEPFTSTASPFEAVVVTYTDRGGEQSLMLETNSSTSCSCNGSQFYLAFCLSKKPSPQDPKVNAWFEPHPEGPAAGPNAYQLNVNSNCNDETLQCEQHVPSLGITFRATIRRKPKVDVPAEFGGGGGGGSSSQDFSSTQGEAADLPLHTSSMAALLSVLSNRSLRTVVLRDLYSVLSALREPLPQLMAALQQAPNLRGIDLDGISIGSAASTGRGDGITPLVSWLRSPDCGLQHVVLRNNDLSIADILEVCEAAVENPRLRTLNLAGNRCGIASLHAFHWALRKHATLRLVVSGTRDFELAHDSTLIHAPRRPRRLEEDQCMFGELKDFPYDD